MKKTGAKIYLILFCLVLILSGSALSVSAAGGIETSRPVEMLIQFDSSGVSIPDAQFDVYKLAGYRENGSIEMTEAFRAVPADLRNATASAEWDALALTCYSYAVSGGITPDRSGSTDAAGRLVFSTDKDGIDCGLYLVVGHNTRFNGRLYRVSPFIVSLPAYDQEEDSMKYEVLFYPKSESEPESDEPITRTVLKVWKDNGYVNRRPQAVTVILYRDGQPFETVMLSASNNWQHEWKELDSKSEWLVAEKPIDPYVVRIQQQGTTFTVENTYPETPPPPSPTPEKPPKLPQTGMLWWPVPVLAAVGIAVLLIGRVSQRRNREEER